MRRREPFLRRSQPAARCARTGLAFDPIDRVVIVANSNEDTPFLSLISSGPDRKILAKIPVPESGENLERSAYHAPSGMFYTVIPVMKSDPTKGLMAQTDPTSGKIVKLHEIERCHPHSLSIVSLTTIFMGCSLGHGSSPKPGGDMAVFDIPSAKVVSYGEGLGGNGGSDINLKLGQYYHSTTNAALFVVDIKTGQLAQKIVTPKDSRSLAVSQTNNRCLPGDNRQRRSVRRLPDGVRALERFTFRRKRIQRWRSSCCTLRVRWMR